MQQLFVFVSLQGEPKRYINFRYCLLSLISPFSVLLDMFSHCATIPIHHRHLFLVIIFYLDTIYFLPETSACAIHVVACLYRTHM